MLTLPPVTGQTDRSEKIQEGTQEISPNKDISSLMESEVALHILFQPIGTLIEVREAYEMLAMSGSTVYLAEIWKLE